MYGPLRGNLESTMCVTLINKQHSAQKDLELKCKLRFLYLI